MADDKAKPAIPAWQRSQSPQEQESTTDGAQPSTQEERGESEASVSADAEVEKGEQSEEQEMTPAQQLKKTKIFLQDPEVRNASEEKKRQFLKMKGISEDLIDQAVKENPFKSNDFEAFQKSQTPAPAQALQVRKYDDSPPIITYPEFLVEAHKPPPIITAERLLNTTYILGGISTLIYAASKHLVAPMSAELNDARHELFAHSQDKLSELNERLSKLASKIPEAKPPKNHSSSLLEPADDDEQEEELSEDSDPTELFHRDMGVQTSPQPSIDEPFSGFYNAKTSAEEAGESPSDGASHDVHSLEKLQSHLNEILSSTEDLATANEKCHHDTWALRRYLSSVVSSAAAARNAVDVWNPAGAAVLQDQQSGNKSHEEDGIAELKKGIRAVKGVMLSASRFPSATAWR